MRPSHRGVSPNEMGRPSRCRHRRLESVPVPVMLRCVVGTLPHSSSLSPPCPPWAPGRPQVVPCGSRTDRLLDCWARIRQACLSPDCCQWRPSTLWDVLVGDATGVVRRSQNAWWLGLGAGLTAPLLNSRCAASITNTNLEPAGKRVHQGLLWSCPPALVSGMLLAQAAAAS